jgi:glycosyltransferase involved in cell wall biosynthesis
MRRALVVAYHFPPSTTVGANSCAQMVRYLPEYGWEPIVLSAPADEFARVEGDSVRSKRSGISGKVLRAASLPHPYGVHRRIRSWLRPKGRGGAAVDGRVTPAWRSSWPGRQLLALLEMPDDHMGWWAPAVWKGMRAARSEGVDCVLSSAPMWTNHVVGLTLRRLTGLPLVVHYRDPWTQVRQWKARSRFSDWTDRRLERAVIHAADAVVCVTDRHRALLERLYPDVPSSRFSTITNGYDEGEWRGIEPVSARDRAGRSAFVITYTGSLYQERSPFPLFRAIRRLADSGSVRLEQMRIDLVGWCEEAEGRSVRAVAEELGLARCVQVLPPVERAEALRRLVGSDLLLLLAEDWTLQVPAKTYEYLRAGPPVLALTQDGALSDVLRKASGTFIVAPTDLEGIERLVGTLFRKWAGGVPTERRDPQEVVMYERKGLAGRLAEVLGAVSSRRHRVADGAMTSRMAGR